MLLSCNIRSLTCKEMLPKKNATDPKSKEQAQVALLNSVDAVDLSEDQTESISGGNSAVFLLLYKSPGELDRIKAEPNQTGE